MKKQGWQSEKSHVEMLSGPAIWSSFFFNQKYKGAPPGGK